MDRSLLPPRGVFVPSEMLYHSSLSPTVLFTWMQLRGLAWGRSETPPLTLQQLSRLTGKSPSALYNHIALLRTSGALGWRTAGKGAIVVSFSGGWVEDGVDSPAGGATPDEAQSPPGRAAQPVQDSGIRDSGFQESAASLNPSIDSSRHNEEVKEGEDDFLKTRIRESERSDPVPGRAGQNEASSRRAERNEEPSKRASPIDVYKSLTGLRPNASQRSLIAGQVDDADLWRQTLEHWQSHAWNPKNVPGMLDLYSRGGPAACVCRKPRPGSEPGNATLSAIDELRKRYGIGRNKRDPGRA